VDLIDADVQPVAIEALLAKVAKCCTAHVKRAYRDWTGQPQRCHVRRDLPGVSRSSIYDIRA
jgi:hypothetical protein